MIEEIGRLGSCSRDDGLQHHAYTHSGGKGLTRARSTKGGGVLESGALRGAAGVGSRRCSPRGGTRDRGVGRPEARMITGTAVGRGSRPASTSRRLAGLSVGCWKEKRQCRR
ncbi:hypothetical protein M6B38_295510 [Iris pallida]|uniref:Uncharacterized protein n=1 Tax=Iris pallida TaxID=29817 RepID=A0AAX6HR91_IRIPA|nr:hypothetical protein M6B38_295510 [Iris pallida]